MIFNWKTINTIADFLAYPENTLQEVRRIVAMLVFGWLAIAVGHWTGVPVSVGFVLGYACGALTVYGSMRMK